MAAPSIDDRAVPLAVYDAVLDKVVVVTQQDGLGVSSLISGERNPTSSTESWLDVRTEVIPVVLGVITAVAIGGSTIADDRHLMGLVILANATAVTATVAGFQDEAGTAKSVVFTGSTSVDTFIPFAGLGLRNNKGVLQVTASVADKVVVLYRQR